SGGQWRRGWQWWSAACTSPQAPIKSMSGSNVKRTGDVAVHILDRVSDHHQDHDHDDHDQHQDQGVFDHSLSALAVLAEHVDQPGDRPWHHLEPSTPTMTLSRCEEP